MRVPRILSLYVLREILLYTGLGLLLIGSILITQNLLRQLDQLASLGFHAADILAVLGCLVGTLVGYAVPIAFLFGVLVAIGRISADSEVTAMRTLGISLAQFSIPSLLLGLLISAATGVLLSEVEPLARVQLQRVFSEIASRGGVIEAGKFNRLDRAGRRLLFADERNEQNQLTGVLISDRTDPTQPFVVVAERGHYSFDPKSASAHIRLQAGDIHFESSDDAQGDYRRISFADFDYAVDMSEFLGTGPSRIMPKDMRTGRILEVLEYFDTHGGRPPPEVRVKPRERYEIQLHRRLALPAAPLLFALVGIPLGLRRSKGARSWGVLICVGLVFVYYSLLSFGSFLVKNDALSAAVAMWIPNAAFAVIAIPLLYRARRAEI